MKTPLDPLLLDAHKVYEREGIYAAVHFLHDAGLDIMPGALQSRFYRAGLRKDRQDIWTVDQLAVLESYYPDVTVPNRVLIEELAKRGRNLDWEAVKRKAHRLGLARHVAGSTQARIAVPSLHISRPLLVLADCHVPFQDAAWIGRCVGLATAWGATAALLAGDTIDAQALSRFERYNLPSFEQEVDATREFLRSLLDHLLHLYLELGNHEARVGKALNWQMSLGRAIETFVVPPELHDRVTVFDSYAVHVNSQLRVEHPKMSSDTTATDLCSHHLMDVAAAHTHHSISRFDRSGRFRAMHLGAGADHSRMPYCTRITHGRYAMTQGALIVVPNGDSNSLDYFNLTPDMPLERLAGLYNPAEWDVEAENVVPFAA